MLTGKPIIFFSYSHKDEAFRDRLADNLKVLVRQGKVQAWHDREIVAGSDWKTEIDEHLESADLFLALVTSSFLASDYCSEKELQVALRRHRSGRSIVVPVIVSPCLWRESPLADLQALPTDGKPVATWTNPDEAWLNVSQGILKALDIIERKKAERVAALPSGLADILESREDQILDKTGKISRNLLRLSAELPELAGRIEEHLAELRELPAQYVRFLESTYIDPAEALGVSSVSLATEFHNLVTKCHAIVTGDLGLFDEIERADTRLDSDLAPEDLGFSREDLDAYRRLGMEEALKENMERRRAKRRPGYFGFNSSVEIMKDLQAITPLTVESIKAVYAAIKPLGDIFRGVKEIGETEAGPEFEE